jgi:hypothetical protein
VRGRYSDDVNVSGQAYACFVRSPHAHARVGRIDTAAARATPGVIAVLTGADAVADGVAAHAQPDAGESPRGDHPPASTWPSWRRIRRCRATACVSWARSWRWSSARRRRPRATAPSAWSCEWTPLPSVDGQPARRGAGRRALYDGTDVERRAWTSTPATRGRGRGVRQRRRTWCG